MSLFQYVQSVNESQVEDALPTLDEVKAAFEAYAKKRASKEQVESIRQRLLRKAKPFLRDTIRLNKLLEDPAKVASLNTLTGMNKTPRFWASKGLNVELLRNAIRQLESARAIPDTLLAIYGILAAVEDKDIKVPSGAHTTKRNLPLYHYLTQIAGWTPERRTVYFAAIDLMVDKVLERIAKRSTTVLKAGSNRRALPVPW